MGGVRVELKILCYLRLIAAEETKESMIHSRDGQRRGTVFDFAFSAMSLPRS